MSTSEPTLIFHQEGVDGEIRVWQQDDRRWLDFNDGLVQSEIILNNPELLPLPLNRAMLAGMMFVDMPKRVLLAGMGGGSTARYFSGCFPDVRGEAVEKSDLVTEIARDLFDFPSDNNWQIVKQDILDYVQNCPEQYDLIVIDIAIEQKTPEWLIDQEFLQQCRSLLTENGHLAFNLLVDDGNDFLHYLSAIREVFDRRTVCLSLPNYRNTVIFAFNHSVQYVETDLLSRLPELESLWGLEFSDFHQQMLKDNPQNSGVF